MAHLNHLVLGDFLFNVCICATQQVQSKVNLKYDSWHKEVLSKFGQMLGQNMQDFHAQISKVEHTLAPNRVLL